MEIIAQTNINATLKNPGLGLTLHLNLIWLNKNKQW